MGLIGFLLGLTVVVWTATGLAGLFAHGAWPSGVTYTGTPLALRHLVSAPHDIAAAWPDTPKAELPGYGLFWGLFVGQLMVLLVLTIFVLGTVARYRAVRATRRDRRRAEAAAARAARPGPAAEAAVPAPAAGAAVAEPVAAQRAGAAAAPGGTAQAAAPAAPPAPAVPSVAAAPAVPAAPQAAAEAAPPPVPAPSPVPVGPAAAVPPVPPAEAAGAAGEDDAALPRVRFGSERAGHRAAALAAAAAAPGPLVLATTDPSLWAETKDARAKLGPVLAYDPTHRLDTPARLRWSPTAGCEEIGTAAARAAALLAPVRPASALDSAVADAAQTLLRCWLHAAALDGRPFRQLHRWAHAAGAAQEPVRILRTSAKASPGQAGELESVLTAYTERRELAKELVGRALTALSSVHIRDASTPLRADSLGLESFAAEGGTLYVVGESIEDPRTDPGAMPLVTALLSHVVEHGRRMAERSSAGRLDPPLTLVLDDIAALAPLPGLPALLATGRERGLLTLATMRSREQARARWPQGFPPA
ncbi:type IV secretory system conjugative DNA transfer family protein [Streptomyces sp. RS10V-4]|nr:type IV secretory system conjugative DNA transfer family protein [Streptomyces rhizoryzae]MCK7624547.1 type IV secretory system conjugative DNA transfer family protein [Streptomyces rhizoryzae]